MPKDFDITPEQLAKAQADVAQIQAVAESLPFIVHRNVIVLIPGKSYFRWTNEWLAGGKLPQLADTEENRWLYAKAYLIGGIGDLKELPALVKRYRKYWLMSYVEGHSPKSRWPWIPSEKEFPDWFDVHWVDGPRDLQNGPISKEPDIASAAGAVSNRT